MKCGKNIGDLKECPYCSGASAAVTDSSSNGESNQAEKAAPQENTPQKEPRPMTDLPPAMEKFAGSAGKTTEGVLGKAQEKINAASAYADKRLLEKNITRDKRLAFGSLVLGVLALLCVFSITSIASGVILAEIGIVTGLAGQKQKAGKKIGLAGICCCAAAIVLAFLPMIMK